MLAQASVSEYTCLGAKNMYNLWHCVICIFFPVMPLLEGDIIKINEQGERAMNIWVPTTNFTCILRKLEAASALNQEEVTENIVTCYIALKMTTAQVFSYVVLWS